MHRAVLPLLAVAVVLAIIGTIARFRKRNGSGPRTGGYLDRFTAASALLTPNERDFLLAVQPLLEPRYRLFAKVRLADLVEIIGPGSKRGPLGRVSQKHLDFVVCDPVTFSPVGVIEVDDATHQRADRATSDATKDTVLGKVGIPLVRVRARGAYRRVDVEEALQRFLEPAVNDGVVAVIAAPVSGIADQAQVLTAACPRCGQVVVERTSKTGNRFLGCSAFPACRYTADATASA